MVSGSGLAEPVPDAGNNRDAVRASGGQVELGSNVADVGLEKGSVPAMVTPGIVYQTGAGHHAAEVVGEQVEQAELDGSELDALGATMNLVGLDVQDEIP